MGWEFADFLTAVLFVQNLAVSRPGGWRLAAGGWRLAAQRTGVIFTAQ